MAPNLRALPPTLEGAHVIFGGSFDPPHLGHQMACLYLLQGLSAQKVILVPVGAHALGKQLSPYATRRAMAERMAAPFGDGVVICDLENERPGPSYMIDTVTALMAQSPHQRFAMAVGADLVDQLPHWHKSQELLRRVDCAIIGREGYDSDSAPCHLPNIASHSVRDKVRHNQSITGLVPHAVAAFIFEHGLYRLS